MSLKVWMPLNKSFENQGLSNTTYTIDIPSGGTVVAFTEGKFGWCLNSVSIDIIVTVPSLASMLANGKSYSLACWVKVSNKATNSWVIKLGTNSCGLWWAASEARWVWNENDNGKRCANPTISSDTTNWHHLVTTVTKSSDGSTTVARHYVDGKPAASYEKHTWDNSANVQPAGNIITINPMAAYLSDIRLYDHCLSEKEVKQLSLGLVLHYPLNRGGWGQENLIVTNSMTPTSGTSGWSSAGTGWANTNVTSSGASNGHAIRCTYSGTTQTSGGIHHPTGVDKTTLANGATYTLSARIRASKACTASFQNELMTKGNTINLTTNGQVYSYSCAIDNTKTYQSNVIYVRAADATQNMWIECDWIKLEAGDKATPWCPNSLDTLASVIGLNSTVEYDASGFCYNGTRSGAFDWSSDTPRYHVSTFFTSNTTKIQAPLVLTAPTAITMACWVKSSSTGKDNYQMPLNIDAGAYEFSIPNNGQFRQGFYVNGSRYVGNYGAVNLLDSNWHHIAATFDGANIKRYIDGQLVNTTAASGVLNTSSAVYISTYGNGTSYGNINMYESDVRIYVTALSATDIRLLYEGQYN